MRVRCQFKLRTLLVAMAVVAILIAGRIAYLRAMAGYHATAQATYVQQWREEQARQSSGPEELRLRSLYFYHRSLSKQYQEAVHRPWTIIRER